MNTIDSNPLTCCLIDHKKKCVRAASNAIYSKRIQDAASEKKLKLTFDKKSPHLRICVFHKNMISSVRKEKKAAAAAAVLTGVPSQSPIPSSVDFNQLHVTALKRYKRHYKLPTRHNLNKSDLVDAIVKHFYAQPVSEMESVSLFVYIVKNGLNKLDSNLSMEAVNHPMPNSMQNHHIHTNSNHQNSNPAVTNSSLSTASGPNSNNYRM
eukprot:Sdes_comp20111_c0_seq1m13133